MISRLVMCVWLAGMAALQAAEPTLTRMWSVVITNQITVSLHALRTGLKGYTAEWSVDLSGMNGISLPSEGLFNHVCPVGQA